jgi:hypothetical protein
MDNERDSYPRSDPERCSCNCGVSPGLKAATTKSLSDAETALTAAVPAPGVSPGSCGSAFERQRGHGSCFALLSVPLPARSSARPRRTWSQQRPKRARWRKPSWLTPMLLALMSRKAGTRLSAGLVQGLASLLRVPAFWSTSFLNRNSLALIGKVDGMGVATKEGSMPATAAGVLVT